MVLNFTSESFIFALLGLKVLNPGSYIGAIKNYRN